MFVVPFHVSKDIIVRKDFGRPTFNSNGENILKAIDLIKMMFLPILMLILKQLQVN